MVANKLELEEHVQVAGQTAQINYSEQRGVDGKTHSKLTVLMPGDSSPSPLVWEINDPITLALATQSLKKAYEMLKGL